jgi:hypothetical protein
MADRLTYFLNTHTLTPCSQFGARKGSSTTDAALTFTHDIQTTRNKGLVTSALTLDIKGYFNFVNHKKLLTKMRQTHLPLPMVKWMASFLTEHQAAICLDGHCTKIKPVLNGLPQGSPISGPASSLYMADILMLMQNIATREHQCACCGEWCPSAFNSFELPSWMLYQDVQLLWDSGLVRGESGYSL